jgi:hypothetical protein
VYRATSLAYENRNEETTRMPSDTIPAKALRFWQLPIVLHFVPVRMVMRLRMANLTRASSGFED